MRMWVALVSSNRFANNNYKTSLFYKSFQNRWSRTRKQLVDVKAGYWQRNHDMMMEMGGKPKETRSLDAEPPPENSPEKSTATLGTPKNDKITTPEKSTATLGANFDTHEYHYDVMLDCTYFDMFHVAKKRDLGFVFGASRSNMFPSGFGCSGVSVLSSLSQL